MGPRIKLFDFDQSMAFAKAGNRIFSVTLWHKDVAKWQMGDIMQMAFPAFHCP